MTQDEVLQIFRDTGALLEGHFILRSGLHSRQFFQCALALQQMPIVEKLGAALAAKVRSLGAVTVIAPALGGLVIGQEVARQLGVRFIFPRKRGGQTRAAARIQNCARRKNARRRGRRDQGRPRAGND